MGGVAPIILGLAGMGLSWAGTNVADPDPEIHRFWQDPEIQIRLFPWMDPGSRSRSVFFHGWIQDPDPDPFGSSNGSFPPKTQ